ncbi:MULTISPECIES: Sec-independent protein translocase protein TatB [Mangrovibacter]|uniref:Sec-independent protein translocase protein TatB n=1 Tax=Mangrovibacter plantisponsor TaxID=451513 RepID=A0A317PQJ8_9ENTR|nr:MULTISPECIES: Sec-independent protein translocase protein TatB [Mangrovibacter]KEA50433.1 preprotein translocase [Mangrovibacter sp. MFB070]PWW02635.1 sec-independent protein translocase protein TatB [Mangrovibacter plantisponsor]
MFDIGFGELLLIFIIGLVVLGPERLPVAVKTVAGWVRALRSLASTVQNELAQELKLQEFQDSLKKVEKASMDHLTPELKSSMDELREAAESMKRSYSQHDPEKLSDEENTIRNPAKQQAEQDEIVSSSTEPGTASETVTSHSSEAPVNSSDVHEPETIAGETSDETPVSSVPTKKG